MNEDLKASSKAAGKNIQAPIHPGMVESKRAGHTPNFSILLVEDEENDALLLQRSFHRANLKTRLQVVNDGEKAVAYLSGQGDYSDRSRFPFPSLMLLDLKLPRKSGLEVLAWLRAQDPAMRELPVIVLTSSRQTIDIDKAYELGANSYMAKPEGDFDGLAEMVKGLEVDH